MKKLVLLLLCLFTLQAFAKIDTPVHWRFASTKVREGTYAVTFTANIDSGWHLFLRGICQVYQYAGSKPSVQNFN